MKLTTVQQSKAVKNSGNEMIEIAENGWYKVLDQIWLVLKP